MYCDQCGSKLIEGDNYCKRCGNRVSTSVTDSIAKKNKECYLSHFGDFIKSPTSIFQYKKFICIGCGIILLCMILLLFGGSSEQKLIDKYFKAFEKNDAEAVLDLFYEPIIESESNATKLNAIRYLKDVDKFYGRYGEDVVKKDMTDIQYFDDDLLEFYNEIYFDEGSGWVKIQKGCEITVDVVSDDGDEYTMRFNCFKIKGKWYIYSVVK